MDTSSLLDTLGQLANTGAGVYGAINGNTAHTTGSAVAPQPASAPAKSWTSYLPWILGGVVVLVLGVILIKK